MSPVQLRNPSTRRAFLLLVLGCAVSALHPAECWEAHARAGTHVWHATPGLPAVVPRRALQDRASNASAGVLFPQGAPPARQPSAGHGANSDHARAPEGPRPRPAAAPEAPLAKPGRPLARGSAPVLALLDTSPALREGALQLVGVPKGAPAPAVHMVRLAIAAQAPVQGPLAATADWRAATRAAAPAQDRGARGTDGSRVGANAARANGSRVGPERRAGPLAPAPGHPNPGPAGWRPASSRAGAGVAPATALLLIAQSPRAAATLDPLHAHDASGSPAPSPRGAAAASAAGQAPGKATSQPAHAQVGARAPAPARQRPAPVSVPAPVLAPGVDGPVQARPPGAEPLRGSVAAGAAALAAAKAVNAARGAAPALAPGLAQVPAAAAPAAQAAQSAAAAMAKAPVSDATLPAAAGEPAERGVTQAAAVPAAAAAAGAPDSGGSSRTFWHPDAQAPGVTLGARLHE